LLGLKNKYLIKVSLSVIIILIVVGIILLVLEILVVPGGILGIAALGMIGFGVYSAYEVYGSTTGHIVLVVSVAATVAAVYYSLKSGVWHRIASKGKIDSKANEVDSTHVQVGTIGVTISDIRPMGTALFGVEKYEVSSEGEKIPVHSDITVMRIEGNKIIIQKTDK